MDIVRTAAMDMELGAANKPPQFLTLDATVLDDAEETKVVRDYIKMDRIKFDFPDGLATVPVFEECRALCDLENFDTMYDLTMQYLTGKVIIISIKNDDGTITELGKTRIADKHDDLRIMTCIAQYPWIVNWLCEFMAGRLSKRFPLPGKTAVPQAAEKRTKKTRAKHTPFSLKNTSE